MSMTIAAAISRSLWAWIWRSRLPAVATAILLADGVAARPAFVKDVSTTPNAGFSSVALTDVNGTAFFAGNDGITGTELWKGDGTRVVDERRSGIIATCPRRGRG